MSEIQRMYPPGKDAVSFSVRSRCEKSDESIFMIDAPHIEGSHLDPSQSSGVIFSHIHYDHFPSRKEKSQKIEVPIYVNPTSKTLLSKFGININIKHLHEIEPRTKVNIDGLGTVTIIPVSHSSVDATALFIETPEGDTIFYTGDIRDGNRTTSAREELKKILGKNRVTLFIGDATGFGKKRISQEDHLHRLKNALRMGKDERVPVSIFIKPGDYGNLFFWFENGVFEGCEVYMAKRLQEMLGEQGLGYNELLEKRYGYKPSEITDETFKESNRERVYIYDESFGNILRGNKHVFVNASRQDVPIKSDNALAVFPIGFSGHSEQAFIDLFEASNPANFTFSHPPSDKKNGSFKPRDSNFVLPKRGSVFRFSE